MAEDDKEFLMRHTLPSQKAPYHNANINVLEERYMRLRWSRQGITPEEAKIEAIKAFARSLGITNLEIKIAKIKEEEPKLSEEEALGLIIRKELGLIRPMSQRLEYLKDESKKPKKDPKKIVSEEELESYLNQGWDLEAVLPSGRLLIKKMA